jgi:hypothetical protein
MKGLPELVRKGMEDGFILRVEELLAELSNSVFQVFTKSVRVSTQGARWTIPSSGLLVFYTLLSVNFFAGVAMASTAKTG